jgi:sulfate transport system permease protein
MRMQLKQPSVLPGFGLTLGLTLTYLSLLVLIPLGALGLRASGMGWGEFWAAVSDPRVVASYRLSFATALAAAVVNAVFGLVVAWVLVRYTFPGKRLVDAMVDLPFALPTAVSGITLTTLYAKTGWIGAWLDQLGISVAYTPMGITVALIFIGLPFVVRTLQPALEDLERETEEAAASLGANRWQTFRRVLFPAIWPALLAGFAMALARGLGEYGSVVFISGNLPMKTEIAPLLIVSKLEQYDYAGACAIAVVLLAASFALLLSINVLQGWSRRYQLKT